MNLLAAFFRILERVLQLSYEFSRKRPWLAIGLFLFMFLISVNGLKHLRITISPTDLVEGSIASVDQLKLFNKDFKVGNQSVLIIEPQTVLTESELCEVRKWISYQRLYNDDVREIFSTFELREVKYQPTKSTLNYPLVLNLKCPAKSELNSPFHHQDRLRNSLAPPTLSDLSGNNIVVFINIKESTDRVKGSLNLSALQKIREHFQTNVSSSLKGAIRSHWIGAADFEYYVNEGMERGKYLNLFFILIVIGFLRLLLGTWKSGFIYIGTLIFVALVIYGLMGYFGTPIDVLTNGIFMIIGIATLEDFIFISRQTESANGDSLKFREMLVPSFLTSLTTFIGFGSLVFADVDSISRLGIWLAMGAMFEWCVVFMLLPALGAKFKFFRRWSLSSTETAQPRSKFAVLLPYLKVMVLVYPLAIFAVGSFQMSDDPYEMLPSSHTLKKSIAQIQRDHGWVGQLNLLYQKDLATEKKREIIRRIAEEDSSIVVDSLEESISKLVKDLPVSIADIVREDMNFSGLKERYVSDSGRERAFIYSKSFDFKYLQGLQDKVSKICTNNQCELIANVLTYKDYSSKISSVLIQSFSLSILLVALLIFLVNLNYGVKEEFLKILLATFFGPAFMVVYIAVSGTSINFMTCVFAAIIVGLTGDNTIQFILSGRKDGIMKGLAPLRVSGLATGFIMAVFSLLYLGSYFEPSRKFGILLFIGFLVGAFGDVFVMESLFQKKLFRRVNRGITVD